MNPQVQAGGKGRRQLVMLTVLFLLPPIAAWLAWQYLGERGVAATTNNGTLISPARPLALQGALESAEGSLNPDEFAGRWLYVVYGQKDCDAACQRQLYVTRQTRVAVNKDMPRVKRLLVLDGVPDAALAQMLAKDHQDLLIAVGLKNEERVKFQGENFDTQGGQFFLVDPLGNLMMFYSADAEPRGVLRDLQKLLKVSQVG